MNRDLRREYITKQVLLPCCLILRLARMVVSLRHFLFWIIVV
jgi:hypothetical protein